jgi:hypothetical protein
MFLITNLLFSFKIWAFLIHISIYICRSYNDAAAFSILSVIKFFVYCGKTSLNAL